MCSFRTTGRAEQAQKLLSQACPTRVLHSSTPPGFIALIPVAAKFEAAGVPIVGDDIRARSAPDRAPHARSFVRDRGTTIDHTYQLNFGGNMDFKNMLERSRLKSRRSPDAVGHSQIDQGISDHDVHIGPYRHVPWLDDRKWALSGSRSQLRRRALTVELKLEVHDSPNRRASSSTRCGAPSSLRPMHRWAGHPGMPVLHEIAARAGARRRRSQRSGAVHQGVTWNTGAVSDDTSADRRARRPAGPNQQH